MDAAQIIDTIQDAGGTIEPQGGRLRIVAPKKVRDALRPELKAHKPEILVLLGWDATDWQQFFDERAGIVEFDAGVPREWAEGYARLCNMPRHPDFTEERWQTLIDDAGRFMDRWARQVAAMGWSTREVFGVGSDKPDARIDVKGLVPCIGGNKVVVVSADSVTIQTHSGNHLRIFRRPDKFSEGRIPIWEVEGDKQRG